LTGCGKKKRQGRSCPYEKKKNGWMVIHPKKTVGVGTIKKKKCLKWFGVQVGGFRAINREKKENPTPIFPHPNQNKKKQKKGMNHLKLSTPNHPTTSTQGFRNWKKRRKISGEKLGDQATNQTPVKNGGETWGPWGKARHVKQCIPVRKGNTKGFSQMREWFFIGVNPRLRSYHLGWQGISQKGTQQKKVDTRRKGGLEKKRKKH